MSDYTSRFEKATARRLFPLRYRRVAGFTVVEMLVVVAIFGIMAMIAAPSFSSLMASKRAESTATDLYVALVAARSEATKRNANATLAQKTGGWQVGWQVSVVDPSDASKTLTLDDHSVTNGLAVSGPDNVVYQSSGRVLGSAAPCFTVTATQGSSTGQLWVWVDLSGRPIVKTSSCS